ncbi:hypothetical protein BH23VER1_BH23VER1_36420 [soil metagenome]
MSATINLLSEEFLTWWPWLLGSLLKVSGWLAVALLAGWVIRRKSASLRHLVAATSALAVPGIFVLNLSPLPESDGWRAFEAFESVRAYVGVTPQETEAVSRDGNLPQPPVVAPPSPSRDDWKPWLVGLWLLGTLVGATRLVVQLSEPRAGRDPLEPGDESARLRDVFATEVQRLSIRKAPRLKFARRTVAMTYGFRRPIIMLPLEAVQWPRDLMVSVLRHELAHVRRRDLWWMLATEISLLVAWPIPFAWIVRRRIARTRELACDDQVLLHGQPADAYAEHLLALLPTGNRVTPTLALTAIGSGDLVGRFRHLLNADLQRKPVTWKGSLLVAAIVLGAIVPGTLFVGCAGHRPPPSTGHPTSFAPLPQVPPLDEKAAMLSIAFTFYELAVESDRVGSIPEFDTLASGGAVLSPAEGWELFNPERRALDLMTAPTMFVIPGQEGKIEVFREFVFPSEYEFDPATGKYVPSDFDTRKTGVSATATARPTGDPSKVAINLTGSVVEFLRFVRYPKFGGVAQPVFHSRIQTANGTFENGSYLVLGSRNDTQAVEDVVPVLGGIPLLGWLFRSNREEPYEKLAAVRVVVTAIGDEGE